MMILDLDGMLKDRETPAYVKEAIRTLKSTGYVTVGSYLQKMSFADINSALDSCEYLFESINTKDRKGMVTAEGLNEGFMSLSEVLAIGEGLETTSSLSVLSPRFNTLKIFLTLEGMTRKNIPIKIFYENMSLREENKSNQRPVAVIDNKEETNASIQTRILSMRGSKGVIGGVQSKENVPEKSDMEDATSSKLGALSKWLSK